MKITYQVSRTKNRQYKWRRYHGNGRIHSNGETFLRLQGAVGAILSDHEKAKPKAETVTAVCKTLRERGSLYYFGATFKLMK